MIMTGETRRTGRKTCPTVILSTTNPIWTGLGSNPTLRSDRTAITQSKLYMLKHMCHGCPLYFRANTIVSL